MSTEYGEVQRRSIDTQRIITHFYYRFWQFRCDRNSKINANAIVTCQLLFGNLCWCRLWVGFRMSVGDYFRQPYATVICPTTTTTTNSFRINSMIFMKIEGRKIIYLPNRLWMERHGTLVHALWSIDHGRLLLIAASPSPLSTLAVSLLTFHSSQSPCWVESKNCSKNQRRNE